MPTLLTHRQTYGYIKHIVLSSAIVATTNITLYNITIYGCFALGFHSYIWKAIVKESTIWNWNRTPLYSPSSISMVRIRAQWSYIYYIVGYNRCRPTHHTKHFSTILFLKSTMYCIQNTYSQFGTQHHQPPLPILPPPPLPPDSIRLDPTE